MAWAVLVIGELHIYLLDYYVGAYSFIIYRGKNVSGNKVCGAPRMVAEKDMVNLRLSTLDFFPFFVSWGPSVIWSMVRHKVILIFSIT